MDGTAAHSKFINILCQKNGFYRIFSWRSFDKTKSQLSFVNRHKMPIFYVCSIYEHTFFHSNNNHQAENDIRQRFNKQFHIHFFFHLMRCLENRAMGKSNKFRKKNIDILTSIHSEFNCNLLVVTRSISNVITAIQLIYHKKREREKMNNILDSSCWLSFGMFWACQRRAHKMKTLRILLIEFIPSQFMISKLFHLITKHKIPWIFMYSYWRSFHKSN